VGSLIESRNLNVGGKKVGELDVYDPATDAVDLGSYRYYAGPATTKVSAAGRCIAASGYLWIGGRRYAVGTKPWVGHCGS
jgi:hypothetical protein